MRGGRIFPARIPNRGLRYQDTGSDTGENGDMSESNPRNVDRFGYFATVAIVSMQVFLLILS